MKRALILVLFVLCSAGYAQNVKIKSLQVYSGTDQLSLPIAASSNDWKQSITIEFDIDAPVKPDLVIEFKFCDINWNSYYNPVLLNQGHNTTQTLKLESINTVSAGANYHFKGSFPGSNITFPFPGKWAFIIKDAARSYEEGYFYVIQQTIPIYTQLSKEVLNAITSDKLELNRVYYLRTSFDLPDSLSASNVVGIEIVENRKIFYPVRIEGKKSGLNSYRYDGKRKFTFTARDLHPGNGYRHLDLRDTALYSYPNTNAKFDEIETSEFHNLREQDLVGGALITDFRDESSKYLNVKFRLRARSRSPKKIFVTGAFTNWRVIPEYEMKREEGIYTIDIPIKRGEYDYQYVTGVVEDGRVTDIDWYSLEGNFWETDNDYHVFVFYFAPGNGGYNKIIGYKKIRSGGL